MPFNLLAGAVEGAAYLILLFGLCFGAVVGVKLVNRKLRERDEKPAPAETAEEKPPASAPKPAAGAPRGNAKKRAARARAQKIYYILERAEEDRAEKAHERAKTK